MPLVTNVNRRAQSAYGSLQPRANMKEYGVIYAAIGDGGDGRWPHLDQVMNEGVPCGTSGKALTYAEFKDANGKPHDVTLGNGMKVREMIAPIDEVRAKEKIECDESQQLVSQYTTQAGIKDRLNEDGRVRLTSEVTEQRLGTVDLAHEELPTQTVAPKPKGLTPEGRAALSAAAKQRWALKKSQPTTTT